MNDENPQLQEIKERERQDINRDLEDLEYLLSIRQGRRFINKILDMTKMHDQSAVTSGSWTYFNEGKRSIGTTLFLEIVGNFPDAYALLIKEKDQ